MVSLLNIWTGAARLGNWEKIIHKIKEPQHTVKIGIAGKYTALKESYKSLNEALVHGGIANNTKVELDYIDSEELEELSPEKLEARFSGSAGILVPGGFGNRGIEGKIKAINYARTQKIPLFGICLGMQLAGRR